MSTCFFCWTPFKENENLHIHISKPNKRYYQPSNHFLSVNELCNKMKPRILIQKMHFQEKASNYQVCSLAEMLKLRYGCICIFCKSPNIQKMLFYCLPGGIFWNSVSVSVSLTDLKILKTLMNLDRNYANSILIDWVIGIENCSRSWRKTDCRLSDIVSNNI